MRMLGEVDMADSLNLIILLNYLYLKIKKCLGPSKFSLKSLRDIWHNLEDKWFVFREIRDSNKRIFPGIKLIKYIYTI